MSAGGDSLLIPLLAIYPHIPPYPPPAEERMELGDGEIKAVRALVGLVVDNPAVASPDDSHRRQETRYEEATRLAMVVLKVARDR
jgi:hypothetical protein